MGVLVEDLLISAKSRSFAPTSQSTFQDTDLITIANEEMLLKLVRDIFIKREDFFLTSRAVQVTNGVAQVPIPKQSIGNTFKSLWYTANGIVQSRIHPGTEEDYLTYSGTTGQPERFLIEGDEVVLLPTPQSVTGSVIFRFYAKPNLLTATANCAKITAINSAGGTTTFTVDTDLTASLFVGSNIDFLSASSPFLLWAYIVPITSISSTQIQVATSGVIDAGSNVEPRIGDYICPTGYANIPMLPYEFHPVLAQMVACRQLLGLGQLDKLQASEQLLQQMRSEAGDMIKNRVESAPKVLKPGANGIMRAFRR